MGDTVLRDVKAEKAQRKRIPMGVPTRRLEVPEIPGKHLHWFLESRVPRALQGGYTYVNFDDVPLNQRGVGTDSTISGNQSLDSRVTILGNTTAEDGRPEYLVLMMIDEEFWLEDQKTLEARNAAIMSALFQNEQILGSERVSSDDRSQSYVGTAKSSIPLFHRPTRKSKT